MATNFLLFGVKSNDSINVFADQDTSISSLFKDLDFDESLYRFTRNGVPVQDPTTVLELDEHEKKSGLVIIRACPRLLGGKGGFGALIRAMGMRVNKNRGRDASRDLSGRRMRDVNAEKQLAEWAKKEPERRKKKEDEKNKKRKEMLEGPRHFFNDPEYMQQLEENEALVEDAVKQGTSLASNGGRKRERREESEEKNGKRKMLMLGMEDLSSSSDDDDDDDKEQETLPVTKKLKDDQPLLPVLPSPPHDDITTTSETSPLLPPLPVPQSTSMIPSMEATNNSNIDSSSISTSPSTETIEESHASNNNNKTVQDTTNDSTSIAPQESNDHTNDSTHNGNTNKDTNNDMIQNGDTNTQNGDIDTSLAKEPVQVVTNIEKKSNETVQIDEETISQFNLEKYSNVEELEMEGPHLLKAVLQRMGLKCGGTLRERAQRLMSVKGVPIDKIDPSLFAGSKNGGGKNKGKKHKNVNKS